MKTFRLLLAASLAAGFLGLAGFSQAQTNVSPVTQGRFPDHIPGLHFATDELFAGFLKSNLTRIVVTVVAAHTNNSVLFPTYETKWSTNAWTSEMVTNDAAFRTVVSNACAVTHASFTNKNLPFRFYLEFIGGFPPLTLPSHAQTFFSFTATYTPTQQVNGTYDMPSPEGISLVRSNVPSFGKLFVPIPGIAPIKWARISDTYTYSEEGVSPTVSTSDTRPDSPQRNIGRFSDSATGEQAIGFNMWLLLDSYSSSALRCKILTIATEDGKMAKYDMLTGKLLSGIVIQGFDGGKPRIVIPPGGDTNGAPFYLERSTNLGGSWTVAGTLSSSDWPITFVDSNCPPSATLFYRTRQ